MTANISQGLIELGFTPRVDYEAVSVNDVITIVWRSAQPRPTDAAIQAAVAAAQTKQDAEDARVAAITSAQPRVDLLQRLRSATPTQISDYVDNQVAGTNAQQVAAIKALLKSILLAIALDARR